MKPIKSNTTYPNLPQRLFWDFDFNKLDWDKSYRTVIERIIERGTKTEWTEMTRYYGKNLIKSTLKNEINYLPEYAIDLVEQNFGLKRTQLKCYKKTQSRHRHWL
ncbi:DUF6922 domain-containing protein [Echinicola rosea]|uniref:DUF6922 domain-containing protein n=1 Tax=Echinicola rosea TaxID=1807691 RepID=UPI003570BC4C